LGDGLAAALILTVALLSITISEWFAARRDHANIAQLKVEIAQRDQTRQLAEALSQPTGKPGDAGSIAIP